MTAPLTGSVLAPECALHGPHEPLDGGRHPRQALAHPFDGGGLDAIRRLRADERHVPLVGCRRVPERSSRKADALVRKLRKVQEAEVKGDARKKPRAIAALAKALQKQAGGKALMPADARAFVFHEQGL